jgi:hypothetical protein
MSKVVNHKSRSTAMSPTYDGVAEVFDWYFDRGTSNSTGRTP